MSDLERRILARLRAHGDRLRARGLRDLVQGEGAQARAAALIGVQDGWLFDLSKRLWDEDVLRDLTTLAEARGVFERFADQLSGALVNGSEGRPALHTAWRARTGPHAARTSAAAAEHAAFARHARTAFEAVLNIGIGGSRLGPQFVIDALKDRTPNAIEARFCSNVDPTAFDRAVQGLKPDKTLVILVSKSFTTQETLANARAAKSWLEAAGVDPGGALAACTAAPDHARAFGVPAERIFPFEDWVGGRFSLWSAAGLAVAVALGEDVVAGLRAGARAADASSRCAKDAFDPSFRLAALDWWSRAVLDRPGRVVAPYAEALGRMPAWLSQVEMESLGKSVTADGAPLDGPSVGAIWGAAGTDAQHAFFQALHQGAPWPVEFIGVRDKAREGADGRGRALIANMIAQGEALLLGRTRAQAEAALLAEGASAEEAARLAPHKAFPGGRESHTLVAPDLGPGALGRLIAIYENKTAFLGYMMGVNPFDQMGVELGKELAHAALADLERGAGRDRDPSTRALIDWFAAGASA